MYYSLKFNFCENWCDFTVKDNKYNPHIHFYSNTYHSSHSYRIHALILNLHYPLKSIQFMIVDSLKSTIFVSLESIHFHVIAQQSSINISQPWNSIDLTETTSFFFMYVFIYRNHEWVLNQLKVAHILFLEDQFDVFVNFN